MELEEKTFRLNRGYRSILILGGFFVVAFGLLIAITFHHTFFRFVGLFFFITGFSIMVKRAKFPLKRIIFSDAIYVHRDSGDKEKFLKISGLQYEIKSGGPYFKGHKEDGSFADIGLAGYFISLPRRKALHEELKKWQVDYK